MMYIVCKLFIIFSGVVLSISTDAVQGQEYLYRPSVNGWIKPHKVAATWHEAYNKCRNEGAELVSPVTEALVAEIKALMNDNQYRGQYVIDVKAIYVPGEFSSTKGVPLHAMPVSDMVQRLDREDGDCLSIDRHQIRVVSCASRLPYFCYRQRKNELLTECGTFDPEYTYNATTGSCYKYHKQEATWQEAYSMCVDEGGHLAVINDDREAKIIGSMFPLYSTYIGLQALYGDAIWTSIHGEPIDTIYNNWYSTGRSRTDTSYRCAFIYGDLDLEPSLCDKKRRFLCERDPHHVQFSFSEL